MTRHLLSVIALSVLICGYSQADERSLEGPWKFKAGDNIEWATSHWDDADWSTAILPGTWQPGGFPDQNQLAWYRQTISVEGLPLQDLGIRMGAVRNAYQIFADGKLLGGIGALPPAEDINYDQLGVYRIPPSLVSDNLEVTIAIRVWGGSQLSVDTSGAGPYVGKFQIGHYTTLVRGLDKEELPKLIFASLFVLTGFYFLYLFAKTGAIPSFPWFGFSALALAVYIVTQSQWKYTLGLPFVTYEKIESVSIFIFLILGIQLIWSVISRSVPWYMRGYQAFYLAVAIIFAVMPGLEIHYQLRLYWQLVAFTLVVPVFWVISQEMIKGNQEAKAMFFGLLILIVCGVNDLLINMDLISSIALMPFGFLAILISMGISLAAKFNGMLLGLELQVTARTVELSQVNEQLAAANHSLVEMTRIDPLTELLNRRGLIAEAEIERQRFIRQKEPLGLIIADIDHFKSFNDQHGHACGDKVLTSIANLLKHSIRDVDRVSRWGGEEFVLLLPGASEIGLANIAEKLRQQIEDHKVDYAGKSLGVTMTFGGAIYHDSETLDECLGRADAALYRGKSNGRNRVELSQ
ncbi:MAG: diguanylate cyclase (GGDEF)-like protein [Candidatus Azotimanducaceae bacterium]|jgi:diguanylate cyclase (GGDEF)-like protein